MTDPQPATAMMDFAAAMRLWHHSGGQLIPCRGGGHSGPQWFGVYASGLGVEAVPVRPPWWVLNAMLAARGAGNRGR